MILLSAHQDKVLDTLDLSFDKGIMTGLLDNLVGILVLNLALFSDTNLLTLEKLGKIKIWYNNSHEWGSINGLPEVSKDDIIVVIDVDSKEQYKGLDFLL